MTGPAYDIAVIGAGLFGSAAARYLAASGASVVVIGASEPPDPATHTGVYASHYDQARLTYRVSRDPLWSYLGRSSIARYRELAQRSGIDFHVPVGRLTAASPRLRHGAPALPDALLASAAAEGVQLVHYPPGDPRLPDHHPLPVFPPASHVLFEPGPAGHINPRLLVQAQLTIARQEGITLIRQEVRGAEGGRTGVTIRTESGRTLLAERVLVAAGAFSNFNRLLPVPIPLRLKTETILLGRVSPAEAERLAGMPVVVYAVDDPQISDIYMTPPLRYPDGNHYVKLGANTVADRWPETLPEVQAWFRQGNSDICLPALSRALRALLPDVPFAGITSARCIVCYTPSGAPTIDRVDDAARFYVAAGGSGQGAKGSDCIGRLAAGLMLGEAWPVEPARAPFTLTR